MSTAFSKSSNSIAVDIFLLKLLRLKLVTLINCDTVFLFGLKPNCSGINKCLSECSGAPFMLLRRLVRAPIREELESYPSQIIRPIRSFVQTALRRADGYLLRSSCLLHFFNLIIIILTFLNTNLTLNLLLTMKFIKVTR